MKKWMKLAGYFAIISFILILISLVIALSKTSDFRIHNHIAKIIVSLFLFLGFLTLGKFSKNRNLMVVSWIILFVSIIINIFSISYLLNPNNLFFLVNNYPISINLSTFLLFLLPSGIQTLLNIFLGIALLKVKDVKFTKETGIFLVIIGILYSIFYLILAPITLSASETSWIYQFFLNISDYQIMSIIIIIILYAIFTYLESTMFFNASKKFEK